MIDNRFLHNLAMERHARHSPLPDVVTITAETRWESDCDYLDSEADYESDDFDGASDDECGEDKGSHSNNKDSVLSQSSAREKLESFLDFAEAAGLDKPSARSALSESMGDEDRFQQVIVDMCDKSAPQADGAPSLACPACLEEFGTSTSMVVFDCDHAACLSCVTLNLGMLRDSSHHAAQPLAQPLACFLGRDRCKGVLFCAQTRAVLRRIQLQARSAGDSEPPPPPEEEAA
eukprot:CAMPEP_0172184994 /NCGR_PEP_ID=MMETSP1050-20130122/19907_1 /TAXON_ID=233186 /ORGANISM="Cryptomonas curvata, Strain CCAP979/52" /LENGTH=232 /DNA_ID=CAMNT_0012858899 /DNA_START=34 /DNA_END=728 /DNA_ORIENTATION=+